MLATPTDRYDPSPAALRPLMAMFWSAQGWRRPAQTPPADQLTRAVTAGVMFDRPRTHSHDEWVQAARRAAAATSPQDVSDAFLESLGSRRLDLRSALGSYAIARVLPEHDFAPNETSRSCAVCGQYPDAGTDLNMLNFERFKWGGVRRDDVRYIAFDLEQFSHAPRRGATDTDRRIGQDLIDTLRYLPDGTSAAQAAAHLTLVKGNRDERETILDILGVCGVLQTPDHHGYRQAFVPAIHREVPPQRFVERTYPVSWWHSHDGVDDDALHTLLPSLR
jgi:hypothetical protein